MSFWNTSDNANALETDGNYESGGGDFSPLPDGTTTISMIDEAKWQTDRNGNEQISIRWTVLQPADYANRKVFQKLWVTDDDPQAKEPAKKRDKALRLLAAIDANAGGKLAKINRKPTDDELTMALTNKQMNVRFGYWSMDDRDNPGKKIEGNYVQAVGPKDKASVKAGEAKPKATPKQAAPSSAFDEELADDVPF